MHKVEAIIRQQMLANVQNGLANIGITSMTIQDVRGRGDQRGYVEIYRGQERVVDAIPRVKIEIVIDDDLVDDCVNAIARHGRTGRVGDGKIYVIPLTREVSIRTGE